MQFEDYLKEKKKSKEWTDYLKLIKERPEAFRPNPVLEIETDLKTICQYEMETGRTIGVVYKSAYSMMVVDLVYSIPGQHFCYERLMPAVKSGAVVSVPMYSSKFVLLQQFRHSLREKQYAFPRGYAEPDLSAAENVKKEVEEEVGTAADGVQHIGQVVADSGTSGNLVDVFVCQVQEPRLKHGYEGIQKMVLLTEKEMEQWISEGRITDGFTLAAFSLWRCRRRQ